VCPTFADYNLGSLFPDVELVLTNSTAQSLSMLKAGKVDYVVAGRKLLPGEEYLNLKSTILENVGYSFLSSLVNSITTVDYDDVDFFTDLDPDVLEKELGIRTITKVDDVYAFLDKGIVITSVENTDYARADLVHVLEADQSRRVPLSRTPILYSKK
jgi:hypothetical protein